MSPTAQGAPVLDVIAPELAGGGLAEAGVFHTVLQSAALRDGEGRRLRVLAHVARHCGVLPGCS